MKIFNNSIYFILIFALLSISFESTAFAKRLEIIPSEIGNGTHISSDCFETDNSLDRFETSIPLVCFKTGITDTVRHPRKPKPHSDLNGIERRDSNNQQVDVIDLVRRVLHPRKKDKDTTIHQRVPSLLHISAVPAAGLSLSTGFAVLVSANAVFYTDKPDSVRLSTLTTSLTYTQKSQILFPVQSSVWFDKNKYNLVTDWRAFKYPQDTYRLGGRSSENSSHPIEYTYLRFNTILLRRIVGNLYAGGGYDYDYYFNINETLPPNSKPSQFQRYGGGKYERSAGISLNVLYDSRHNPINADNGYYLSMAFRQNYKVLGAQNKYSSFVLDARKYIELPDWNSVLAFWTYDWLTVNGKPPFFTLPDTGGDTYNNTGRGYIQGRFRDRQMLYLESEFRYTITHNGLLGGVIFINGQSFSKSLSKELQVINPAAGLGLRIKLNKFSKTNIAIDYGLGTHGSRGLFVNLGEVF